jgi:alkanesulfonate monooxygenase SsuD/methylene tetrahydromethanopterin reductase-like flavin-dependent oxidoreductase (luciferase family)
MAYTAWDLAAQSNGRFILGLGTQIKAHIERRFGLEWPASVTRKLREQIQAMRAIWNTWQNDAPLNFRGEYYKITLMPPFFNPGPLLPFPASGEGAGSVVLPALVPQAQVSLSKGGGFVPIYIAGVNIGLAQLTGELCDGFHVHPFHTPEYLKQTLLPAIANGAEKAGRSTAGVTISATIFIATDEAGLAFCRRQIAFYASTPSYRPVMQLHGWGAAAEKLSSLAARKQWDEMPAQITDAMLDTFVTQAADENDLAAAIHKRYDGLADRITLYQPFVPGERDAFWSRLAASF